MGSCNTSTNCNPCGPDFNAINQLATRAGAYARQANTYSVDAQNAWLEFNALYLGAFAVAPTVDNEGNPLQTGALYWNTALTQLFAWSGTVWVPTNFNQFTNFTATGRPTERNLVTRFADIFNVKDFGVIGDGVTDDTAAIQAAVTAAGNAGGGIVHIPSGMKILIDSADIVIPRYVSIQSDFYSFSYLEGNQSTAIIINPLYTLRANGIGTSFKGLYIMRKGFTRGNGVEALYAGTAITLKAYGPTINAGSFVVGNNYQIQNIGTTNYTAIGASSNTVGLVFKATGVGSGSGSAIAIALSDDVAIYDCHIIGFEYAIWGTSCGRFEINHVSGDNTNGIYLRESYDIGRINDCHFWPFGTVGFGTSYRSGVGYNIDFQNDWTQMQNCFCFNYETGFRIAGSSVRLIGCGADGNLASSISGTSKGFWITRSQPDVQLIGCQAAARHANYYIDNTSVTKLIACSGWGAVPNHVHIVDGSAYINNCHFYNPTTDASIKVGPNADNVQISGTTFESVGAAFNIDPASLYKTSILPDNKYLGGVTGLNSETHKNIVTSPATGQSNYVFGGGNGYQTRTYLARGNASAPTVVNSGESLGTYRFFGYNGTSFDQTAVIRGGVDGTPGPNVGGNIIFTTQNELGSGADRLAIDKNGNLRPTSDDAYTCGSLGNRWATVWAANGTIQTSDEREKKDVQPTELGLDFINALNPVSYKWKVGGQKVIRQVYRDAEGNEVESTADDAIPSEIITEKIEGHRTHHGLLAQEVKAALPEGVDFGGWVLTDKDNPDSQQALRYDQFISPLIKAVKELSQENTSLKQRIEALEAK